MKCPKRIVALVVIVLMITGCLPKYRDGYVNKRDPAIQLTTGAPKNKCEEAEWLEVAVADVTGSGSIRGGDKYGNVWTRTVTIKDRGLVVFRPNSSLGLTAEALLPLVNGNTVARKRYREMKGYDRRLALSQTAVVGGLIIMLAGLAVLIPALLIEDDTPEFDGFQKTLLYTSLGAFAFGGIIAPLGLLFPTPKARAKRAFRSKAYQADVDLDELAKGVDEHNRRVRADCR